MVRNVVDVFGCNITCCTIEDGIEEIRKKVNYDYVVVYKKSV